MIWPRNSGSLQNCPHSSARGPAFWPAPPAPRPPPLLHRPPLVAAGGQRRGVQAPLGEQGGPVRDLEVCTGKKSRFRVRGTGFGTEKKAKRSMQGIWDAPYEERDENKLSERRKSNKMQHTSRDNSRAITQEAPPPAAAPHRRRSHSRRPAPWHPAPSLRLQRRRPVPSGCRHHQRQRPCRLSCGGWR